MIRTRPRDRVVRRPRFRPAVAGLESRALLAVTYQTFQIPAAPNLGAAPNSIVVGPDDAIWFASSTVNGGLAYQTPEIGRLDPTTGAFTSYPVGTGGYGPNVPNSLINGPGGDLWFVYGEFPGILASIDPATGTITQYPTGIANADPVGLAAGADGKLYFADATNDAIGVLDPATKAVTEYPLPDGAQFSTVSGGYVVHYWTGQLANGPDGKIWFTAFLPVGDGYTLGAIDPATHAISLSVLPNIDDIPTALTAGTDGKVWFNESHGFATNYPTPKIASVDPATGDIATYAGGQLSGITAADDGDLWSVGGQPYGTGALSQFDTTTHVSTSFALPNNITVPYQGRTITAAADGTLWIAASAYIIAARVVAPDQATLTGQVVEDPDSTGANGKGLASQTVFVDLNDDGTLDPGDPTAITDALGQYTFNGLAPGTYKVEVAPYPGTIATYPVGGGQSVTLVGGQVTAAGVLGVIPTSSLLPLSYAADLFGGSNASVQQAMVNAIYQTVLGRMPDATGGANAVAYLKSGGSPAQLAGDLLASDGYRNRTVTSFYQDYLDRAPTAGELSSGIAFLAGGGTQDALAAQLLDSAEFGTLHATDQAFVEQLYIVLLGRQATTGEVSSWVAQLQGGTTRPQVVTSLMDSVESDTRVVQGMYDLLFGPYSGTEPKQAVTRNVLNLQSGNYQPINILVSLFIDPAFITRANKTVTT